MVCPSCGNTQSKRACFGAFSSGDPVDEFTLIESFQGTEDGRLVDFFADARPSAPPEVFPELSDREREILDLIARGQKNTEIAQRLYLSPKTVRNHVSNVLHKLRAADRSEAIIRAKDAGLG